MKPTFSTFIHLGLAMFGWLSLSGNARAQVATVMHNFGDGTTLPANLFSVNSGNPSNDVTSPANALVQGKDGNFYGTISSGGEGASGGVFVMTPAGVVTVVHNFGADAAYNPDGSLASLDGLNPSAALIQGIGNDTNFYGTTSSGGSQGNGTVFSATPGGMVTILHNFGDGSALNPTDPADSDGAEPVAALVEDTHGNFYGTTQGGGAANNGTVFVMDSHGNVTILHNFRDGSAKNPNGSTATDGSNPLAGLFLATDGKLYGTTQGGGANNGGTVFAINPVGAANPGLVTIVHSFGASNVKDNHGNAVTDGTTPEAGLIEGTDGRLYGTTRFGGANEDDGTVFAMNLLGAATNPGVVTIMHSFGSSTVLNSLGVSVTDGNSPVAGLCLGADHNFYGTTLFGGANNGTVFSMTTQGVVTILHIFGDGTSINPDGTLTNNGQTTTEGLNPEAGVIQGTDGNFYGVCNDGGLGPYIDFSNTPDGTIFKIAITTPSLTGPQFLGGINSYPVNFSITATNNPTNYAAANLPAGLSINATTGVVTGTATAAGTGDAVITFTNAAGSNIVLLPCNITNFVFGVNAALPANFEFHPPPTLNEFPPDSWTISPLPLPAGLSFDTNTGTLSGTPTNGGVYVFTVTADYTNEGTQAPVVRSEEAYAMAFAQTFSSWAGGFSNASLASKPYGTPEKDRVPNLLKYLCDINPSRPMSPTDQAALPAVGIDTKTTSGKQYLELTFRQYSLETGLTVQLETSSDLQTWTPVATPDLQKQLNPGTAGDPIMEMGVLLPTTTTREFIRMELNQTP